MAGETEVIDRCQEEPCKSALRAVDAAERGWKDACDDVAGAEKYVTKTTTAAGTVFGGTITAGGAAAAALKLTAAATFFWGLAIATAVVLVVVVITVVVKNAKYDEMVEACKKARSIYNDAYTKMQFVCERKCWPPKFSCNCH